MTKITYIPGEIANAAIDEHGKRKPVTRTQHIFDDAKGKSQAEVNADIDNTLALHQSEINALNSQNYVTVDSFNALPATGEADTIYRVSNWDGTQQDPTVYSEYAWNGSQYIHLSTKTQIGEVFDISAYHATGGTLATFADLTAALGTNGANVPEGIRKGGMSIKFVQSSDNKYVQFRYMGTAVIGNPNPFLDVDNWQGVDDEPTFESDNLVKSGGVSALLYNNFFKGKDNVYSYVWLKSVIPNSRYIVVIDKDNISHQNVTATGVFSFAIISKDINNVETRLATFQTTAYDSIPRYVIVTVPSDSERLEIGGRADVGTEVHFAILPYSAIYLQKHVYFTDATIPVFTVSSNGNILNVVLPENKVMHIYGPNGLEKEVDLSQQQTLSFNIQSMQKLIYNYRTNNIGVVSITRNYEDGTIVDLLVVNGTARAGAVTGLLAGYYYNQFATNVDYLLNHDAEIYGIDISTDLLNGTPNNYNNTYAVRSNRIPVEGFVPYEVFTTKPVSAEGNYYSYSVMLRDKNGNILLNIIAPRTDLKKYITIENTAYVEFGIFELDSNGEYVTLRTTDFEGYDTYIKIDSVRKCLSDNNNTNGGIVYFTNAKWPSFVTDNRGLTVTFPEGELMRIYSNNGTVLEYNLNNLASREFTLNSLRKLVYDWDNNTISVVRIDAVGNFFVLISLGGSAINHGTIDGALRGYYIAWLKTRLEVLENKEEKTNPDEIAAIGNIQKWADFKFLFFSDVHAGWTNVQRVVDYAENLGASKCDCIINGGDTVLNRITDGLDQYNDIIEESSIPVLSVPGNHDCWTGSNWNWADQKDIYNLITAEVASTVPTIVQPANAATEGLNYYYKDFGMVRVICLTAMQNGSDNLYFDTAQQNWLTDVLESARNRLYYFKATAYGIEDYTLQEGDTVSKVYTHFADMNADTRNMVTGNIYAVRTGVIIVTHAPFALSDRVEISAKLNSWVNATINPTRSKGIAEDGLKINDAALSIVDTYINNGGAFICWLTGHRHVDTTVKHKTYNGQFMIGITTANASRRNIDCYNTTDVNNANYDGFNYIGIDLRSCMIKVLRVGSAQDSSMRIRRSWCYDYANKILMSEN